MRKLHYSPLWLSCCLLLTCGTGSSIPTPPEAAETKVTYREPHRPQLHYSPPANWMNDPNGMVYHEGEYHLFYQYYPDSTVWGPMHWGHAVSSDLISWENLPVALYPDSLGYIFSGSAVVDSNNTSGLGEGGVAPLVAIFTYHDAEGQAAGSMDYQSQGIAYSNDQGRSWTKYQRNPVLPNPGDLPDFRDPKVSWDSASGQWVMTLAVRDRISFYGSDNLIDWRHLSDFGKALGSHVGVWECPDLFPLTVDGTDTERYVLLVSVNAGAPNGGTGTQYFVGDFDGVTFTPDASFLGDVQDGKGVWLDYGRDNYAGVTWSDVPAADGRRLFLGWMSNWAYANAVPTEGWRGAMTIPRELTLHRTPAGYRVFSTPIDELAELRQSDFEIAKDDTQPGLLFEENFAPARPAQPPLPDVQMPKELRLTYRLDPGSTARFGVALANGAGDSYRIGYDAGNGHYFSDRAQAGDHQFSDSFAEAIATAPRIVEGRTLDMHLLLDRASAELFADGGATVITEIFFPSEDFDRMRLFVEGEGVELVEGKGYSLASIWDGSMPAEASATKTER